MGVQHCKRCDKLFAKIKSPYCSECGEEIEKQFKIIRDYIQANPTADISTIIEETKVEEPILLYLLRGRAAFLDSSVRNPVQELRETDQMRQVLRRMYGKNDQRL